MKTNEAIQFFGSVTALATALGVRRQAIYQWGDTVPQRRCYEIEIKSGGALKAAVQDADCGHVKQVVTAAA